MSTLRTLFQLIKADALERIRRKSFLVIVAATLYLGYLVATGTIGLHLGHYRGVLNAPWVGLLVALCGTTFVSLFGFFAVKNAVDRDRRTGVGQILAGTPVSKLLYLAAKTLSNFIVLAFVIIVLALAAVLLFVFQREQGAFDLAALLLPFLLLALPSMMFTAAMAVFFESTPGLRGGFGNVVFFIIWTAMIVVPMQTESLRTDVTGIKLAIDRLQSDLRTLAPAYDGHFTLGTESGDKTKATPLVWHGMNWTATDLGWRLLPFGWALALVGCAALWFDRFDVKAAPRAEKEPSGSRWSRLGHFLLKPLELAIRLLAVVMDRTGFGRMLVAELRLMLLSQAWWWHLAALGLWIFSLTQDPDFSRANLLPSLWLWPMFLWSVMGTRESRERTAPVLFSCPRPVMRQLPALWTAGVLVAFAFASGILIRLLLAGDFGTAVAVSAGAVFVPTLALALGTWSGGSMAFEVIYFAGWYVGPLQHMPSLDFMATTQASIDAGTPLGVALLTCLLIPASLLGRLRALHT